MCEKLKRRRRNIKGGGPHKKGQGGWTLPRDEVEMALPQGGQDQGFSAFHYFKKIYNYNKVINCFVIKYQNN